MKISLNSTVFFKNRDISLWKLEDYVYLCLRIENNFSVRITEMQLYLVEAWKNIDSFQWELEQYEKKTKNKNVRT